MAIQHWNKCRFCSTLMFVIKLLWMNYVIQSVVFSVFYLSCCTSYCISIGGFSPGHQQSPSALARNMLNRGRQDTLKRLDGLWLFAPAGPGGGSWPNRLPAFYHQESNHSSLKMIVKTTQLWTKLVNPTNDQHEISIMPTGATSASWCIWWFVMITPIALAPSRQVFQAFRRFRRFSIVAFSHQWSVNEPSLSIIDNQLFVN